MSDIPYNQQPILSEGDLPDDSYFDDVDWPYPRLIATYKALAALTEEQAKTVVKINAMVCHGCWSQPIGCCCQNDE